MPSSTYYAVLLALVLGVGCGKKDEWPEFKTCERCKEADIKYWADVCKHCGKDPDGPNGVEKRAELMKIWLEEQRTENDNESVEERFLAGELTKADYEKVTELSLTYDQLTEVPKGLEKLTQLKDLSLGANHLTDVKGLEKLTQLEEKKFGMKKP